MSPSRRSPPSTPDINNQEDSNGFDTPLDGTQLSRCGSYSYSRCQAMVPCARGLGTQNATRSVGKAYRGKMARSMSAWSRRSFSWRSRLSSSRSVRSSPDSRRPGALQANLVRRHRGHRADPQRIAPAPRRTGTTSEDTHRALPRRAGQPLGTALIHCAQAPRRTCRGSLRSPRLPEPLPGPHRFHWADLLARVFSVDAFACPSCGGRMTVRAVVLPGAGTLDVLRGLQGAARAPPAEELPARA